jgi:hypothetical protein
LAGSSFSSFLGSSAGLSATLTFAALALAAAAFSAAALLSSFLPDSRAIKSPMITTPPTPPTM